MKNLIGKHCFYKDSVNEKFTHFGIIVGIHHVLGAEVFADKRDILGIGGKKYFISLDRLMLY